MNKIIIIGVTHHNTLGMIRCIGMAGYLADCILIGKKGSYVTKSRYLNDVHYLSDINELKTFLDTHYHFCNEKPVIISCTDQIENVLDQNYEVLKNRFYFFHSGKNGVVTHCMNKFIQTNLAKEVGLATPWSFEYKGNLSKIDFPCLLKPLQSICGGKQVVICNNDAELTLGIHSFDKEDSILIQQFIKKEHEIVVLGLSVDGKVLIPGYILKHREFNGGTLYSTVKSITSLDNVLIEKCRNLIFKMNYQGLFGIEFIYSKGKYYFIEINLRNDATTYALAVAGVNLPELYVKAKIDGTKLSNEYKVTELSSIVEFNDFKHRKHFNISTIQWLKQYLKAKCKYYLNRNDLKPFFYAPFKKKHE